MYVHSRCDLPLSYRKDLRFLRQFSRASAIVQNEVIESGKLVLETIPGAVLRLSTTRDLQKMCYIKEITRIKETDRTISKK